MSGKFALIVANTEYVDPGLAQLSAPGKDAEDLARVFKDQAICAFDDVKVLLNQPEHIVRRAIEVYFDQRKPSDLVVFYFSGHGIRDELGALYLAVKNTVRSRLRSTAIKSDYIREIMDQSRSKRQVLILDCCNSGAFAQGTKAATGVSIGTSTAFEGTGYGRIVLTATDSTQFAWEGDKVLGEAENSLFTHFLVKGLEGEADQDGDGTITIDELYDYTYEQIVSRTPKQTPGKWSYKQQGEIVLRERVKTEESRPVPLPADLLTAIENILPYVREGAVRQLGELLKGKNMGLARSARARLEKMAIEDDSKYVASAARKILDSSDQIEEDSAKNEKANETSQEQKESPAITKQNIENERILQMRADAIRIAREKEQHERRQQPGPAPKPTKKVTEPIARRPFAVWAIPVLVAIMFLLYVAISSLNLAPFAGPQPTEPSPSEQSMIMATSPLISTNIPTDPPTTAPLIFTVVVTSPPGSSSSIPSDPTAFIYFYFENINKHNYELTWSLLSDKYKAKTNPDGIGQYMDFWNGYTKVELTSVEYTPLTTTSAKMSLTAVFYKGNLSSSHKLTYYLTSDNPQGIWLFDVAPAAFSSASDTTCETVPKRLSVGIRAKVVTATDPLLLRENPQEQALTLERMYPGTIVIVLDGPSCRLYRSVYFWWWKVQSPAGRIGWVVEGSDLTDLIFIQPAQ